MLDSLAKRHEYVLAAVEYNNAFLIPTEAYCGPGLTPEEGYRIGYVDRPDRQQRLPWNKDMEPLLTMDRDAAFAFVNEKFRAYEGRYILE